VNISTAKAITKSFINMGVKRTPFIATDWEFILEDESVYLVSDENHLKYYFSSLNTYSKMYLFGPFKHDINDNKLLESSYYTSCGFVSEDDFFLAEDVISQNIKFKLSQMNNRNLYLSDNGKEYLYIFEYKLEIIKERFITTGKIIKERFINKNVLYDISNRKFIKFSSVNIITDLGDSHERMVHILISESDISSAKILSIKINDEIINKYKNHYLVHNYVNSNNLSEYQSKQIIDFINSDDLELTLTEYNECDDKDLSADLITIVSELINKSSFFTEDLRDLISEEMSEIFIDETLINIPDLIDFFNNFTYLDKTKINIYLLLNVYDEYGNFPSIIETIKRFSFNNKISKSVAKMMLFNFIIEQNQSY